MKIFESFFSDLRKFLMMFSMILLSFPVINAREDLPYRNAALPVSRRVEDLLSRMTLEEKIGQMSMVSLRKLKTDKNGMVTERSLKKLFNGQSPGCLESPFIGVEEIAKYSEAADRYLWEDTRLGIPAIQIAECLHGQLAFGATIFPQAIAQGSTWNPELVQDDRTGHKVEVIKFRQNSSEPIKLDLPSGGGFLLKVIQD